MSRQDGKPDRTLPSPDITSLGNWPSAIENIRQMAREHGIPADEIEPFLDAIIKAKSKDRDAQREWPFLDEVEVAYVDTVLRHTNGNKQAAARLLKIDRKTLDRMIKRNS
jgi:ActR/RegA family two-component response regulator